MAQLELLIESLRRLPGVGPKAAQRIAYHLLQHDRAGADQLGRALCSAVTAVQHCQRCNTFTEQDICLTCRNPKRDATQLCVVETPADQNMIESSHGYNGLYYVLLGRLSPLDGIGPDSLKFNQLLKRADDGVVKEVILATSFTAEGETTAHFLTQALKARGVRCTRLARGVPVGSELEYVDAGTIAYALMDRRES